MRKRSEATPVQVTGQTGVEVVDVGEIAAERAGGVWMARQSLASSITNSADDTYDEGAVVEVGWGEERFSPVQYQTFGVGPFKVSTKVRKGESIAAAIVRVHREMDRALCEGGILATKAADFFDRLKEVDRVARQKSGG